MADEWWSSTARADDGGGGASACSTDPAAEASPAATSTAASMDFRAGRLHADDAAASFLADPSLPHMDWTQAYIMGGGRAAAEASSSFNDVLIHHQLHGDAGRHFLPAQEPGVVDGASLYADNNQYSSSSYGDAPAAAALMAKPFPQQEFSGFFGSSARNFEDVPAVQPPPTTKPLLLQTLEHKKAAFKPHNKARTQAQDACSSATRASAPDSPAPAKKPRVATPSPLPTFKVRKEKLGDRITALQQLVSPFGKTDTASVLHEAIEYIRFLHDQVASLSSPYLRCGRHVQQLRHQQQAKDGDGGEAKEEDLRSRGLCLVPVASTYYAVASETAPEFWHPAFGGTSR